MRSIQWFLFGFAALLTLLRISVVRSTTFYVSSENGSNTNDGLSPAAPFKTIKKARDAVQGGGDTVIVFNGTYRNSNYGSGRYFRRYPILTINRGGNDVDGYVTYKAAEGHRPKLEYDGDSAISINSNVNYIIIEGFEVVGPAQQITYEMAIANRFRNSTTEQEAYYTNRGITGWGPSHHLTIRNCFVHETCGSGIRLNDADYVTIENCDVVNTSWWSSSAESAIVMAEAIPIDSSTDVKMIFRGNRLFDNWNRIPFYQPSHDGLTAYPDYGEATQNYILDGQGLYVTRCVDSYAGTFLFENNVVVNSGKNGINFDGVKGGGAIIQYNTLYHNGAFDFVQTEHHGPNEVAGVAAKKVGFMNVTNNIIVCRNSTYSAFSVWDDSATSVVGNMLVGCSINLRIPDEDTTYVDALDFVHASTSVLDSNFRLTSASPAIGAANDAYMTSVDFDGVTRPQGIKADVGAFEYVATIVPPTTTMSSTDTTEAATFTSAEAYTVTTTNVPTTAHISVSTEAATLSTTSTAAIVTTDDATPTTASLRATTFSSMPLTTTAMSTVTSASANDGELTTVQAIPTTEILRATTESATSEGARDSSLYSTTAAVQTTPALDSITTLAPSSSTEAIDTLSTESAASGITTDLTYPPITGEGAPSASGFFDDYASSILIGGGVLVFVAFALVTCFCVRCMRLSTKGQEHDDQNDAGNSSGIEIEMTSRPSTLPGTHADDPVNLVDL